jgi:hypothetical protein
MQNTAAISFVSVAAGKPYRILNAAELVGKEALDEIHSAIAAATLRTDVGVA